MAIVARRPTSKGAPEWFTGDVYVDPIEQGGPSRLLVGIVHFTPGARSAWHSHGTSQTLYVTEGSGLVQSRGGEIHELHAGDVVVAGPGEEHWHGAAPEHFMTHISIIESDPERPDHWGDHVSDNEYPG